MKKVLTETRTHTDKYSLRTIDRTITHNDHTGVTKTTEREVVRERSFIKKAELSEEFDLVKDLYIEHINEKTHKLITKWTTPSYVESRAFQNRANEMKKYLRTSPMTRMHNTTLSHIITAMKDNFVASTKVLGSQLASIQQTGKYPNVNDKVVFNRFLQMALYRAINPYKRKQRADQILKAIQCDEEETIEPLYRVDQVTRHITRPYKHIFPFTQHTFQTIETYDIAIDGNVSRDVYQAFITLALQSHGLSDELLCPVIRECVTYHLVLGYSPFTTFDLPELTQICDIKQYKISSIAFTYTDLWGRRKKDLEYMASCEFKIDDKIYPAILIELPLLMTSVKYAPIAQAAFVKLYNNTVCKQISQYRTSEELLGNHPECSLFSRLTRLTQDVHRYEQDTTELKELREAQAKLQHTMDRLTTRSRNT